MQKSIAMIKNVPHCHPEPPLRKEDFKVAIGRKAVLHPQVCYKNHTPITCRNTKKASLPPTQNVEENPAALSVDDSDVSLLNSNSLNDTLEDIYDDQDETWTPSVSSFDSDDSDDDDCKIWKASTVRPADFVLTYVQMELELEFNYVQEVHEVKRRILNVMNIIKGKNLKGSISATDIFNVIMPTNLIFDMMTFMNIYLMRNNQAQINLEEVWGFFRAFF